MRITRLRTDAFVLQEGDRIETYEVKVKQLSLEEASVGLGAANIEKALDKAEQLAGVA